VAFLPQKAVNATKQLSRNYGSIVHNVHNVHRIDCGAKKKRLFWNFGVGRRFEHLQSELTELLLNLIVVRRTFVRGQGREFVDIVFFGVTCTLERGRGCEHCEHGEH
jgi:hypothetical protein